MTNSIAMWIGALLILPAIGLVSWSAFTLTRGVDELLSFRGFEGMHFEV
jgi:hypothetical protein